MPSLHDVTANYFQVMAQSEQLHTILTELLMAFFLEKRGKVQRKHLGSQPFKVACNCSKCLLGEVQEKVLQWRGRVAKQEDTPGLMPPLRPGTLCPHLSYISAC